jgi:hypothetical protein
LQLLRIWGILFFGEATVQMLPDFCSNKIGFTVQVRRITHFIFKPVFVTVCAIKFIITS